MKLHFALSSLLALVTFFSIGVLCNRLKPRSRVLFQPGDKGLGSTDASDQHVRSMRQHQRSAVPDANNRFFAPPKSPPPGRQDVSIASVVYQSGQFKVVPNSWETNSLAYGMLARTLNSTGWDVLDVIAGTDFNPQNDTATMYAAGMLEGFLTGDRIAVMYQNTLAFSFPSEHDQKVLLPRVRSFLAAQYQWARDFAAKNSDSTFARHTGLVLAQLQGLIDGYLALNSTVVRDPFVLHLLNAEGDLGDIQTALNDTKPDYFDRMTQAEFKSFVQSSGHCSALVRLTPGLEKLFMGHSTWGEYATMLRMYKHYYLHLLDRDQAARGLSFSSYPGSLESIDDFYILDSGLVILETTNNVFNVSLFKFIKPQSLLSWQRVRVASQLARNGSHWAWAVAQQNSGTYNNQYVIIDLNRIRPSVAVDDGALTIVEQIPALVVWSDQTAILRTGYFPSYNVPFHEIIYNLSGYPDTVKARGLDFSYQMAPRAKIFRREAPLVFSESGMSGLLRFNRFKDDPYSEGDPCDTICCRRDLRPPGADRLARGCLDSKFTSFDLARYMTSYAISGPTVGDADFTLPPFAWAQFPDISHIGMPPTYNFSWVPMSPTVLL